MIAGILNKNDDKIEFATNKLKLLGHDDLSIEVIKGDINDRYYEEIEKSQ